VAKVTGAEVSEDNVGAKFVVSRGPDWEQEFGELFGKLRGSKRLRVERPHTGEIGSWGVKQAVTDLSTERGCEPLSAQVLMGLKSGPKVEVPVSKNDTDDVIEKQWSALKSTFSRPNAALLFHLTNHYALIYAWREWLEENEGSPSKMRRQILTARKGQRPTVWLDFEEARSIMSSWSGYHVLQLQRPLSSTVSSGGIELGSPGGA